VRTRHEAAAPAAALGLTREQRIAGFAIKEFTQPPYRRLPWHEHPDASVCFVVSGSYTERLGGQDRECAPHTLVFKPPVERHADRFGRAGGTCLLIEIPPGRLATLEPCAGVMREPKLVHDARLAALGHHIYREFGGLDDLSPLALEGAILDLLVEATRVVGRQRSSRPPRWLREAHDLIRDGFRESITLSTVAGAVSIHPAHLARMFRRFYGASIGAYVRRLRIEHAARELARPGASLGEIGVRAGFYDQSHFSRVFKYQLGQTPAQFRDAARARHPSTNPHRPS
jgi:AraC family transcriptional regulator